MDVPAHLVAQFCAVTNADASLASQLLRHNALDMDAAISSSFAIQDAGGLPHASHAADRSASPPPRAPTPSSPPRTPAPLPQMVERLLPAMPAPPRNANIMQRQALHIANIDGLKHEKVGSQRQLRRMFVDVFVDLFMLVRACS